jgi:hypothetical protein
MGLDVVLLHLVYWYLPTSGDLNQQDQVRNQNIGHCIWLFGDVLWHKIIPPGVMYALLVDLTSQSSSPFWKTHSVFFKKQYVYLPVYLNKS